MSAALLRAAVEPIVGETNRIYLRTFGHFFPYSTQISHDNFWTNLSCLFLACSQTSVTEDLSVHKHRLIVLSVIRYFRKKIITQM